MFRFVRGEQDNGYAYGLVFRHVDRDYGFFGLRNDGGFRLMWVYGSSPYTHIEWSSDAIHTEPGQVNRITVRAIGNDFVFQINDQVVWQLNEDIAAGDIGLGVDTPTRHGVSQVEFTNFEIRAPVTR